MDEVATAWIADPSWELKEWDAGPYADRSLNAAFWSQATDGQRATALSALSDLVIELRRAGIYPARDEPMFPGLPGHGADAHPLQ